MGEYREIDQLNEAHGVFLVRDEESGRICVKKIQKTYNADVYKRLKASKIKGIPEIYEMYEQDRILTLIEEFVSGETLEAILKREGAFSEERVRDITIRLCTVLSNLHSMNPPVIHRDIKPSNVMITSYGDVFLIDLNAAKLENTKKDEDTVLLGTYGYAAPEQFGFGTSTVQTDIYALGMLMNTMLKGQYSKEVAESLSLKQIIEKCIMLKPEDRYSSVNELRETLVPEKPEKLPENKRFMPPGFRTGNPTHIVLACIGYAAVLAAGLTIVSNNQKNALITWHERIFFLIMTLTIIFFSADYLQIQSRLPLCRSKNTLIRVIGVALFDVIIFFVMMIIMLLIESLLISLAGG